MDLENPHRLNDLRSLAIHALVADHISADPGLLERPRARVREWLETGSTHSHYAQAWAELLDGPVDELLALLRDEGERAIALRHCSPFAGLVDPQSRWRIWRDVEARWAKERGVTRLQLEPDVEIRDGEAWIDEVERRASAAVCGLPGLEWSEARARAEERPSRSWK